MNIAVRLLLVSVTLLILGPDIGMASENDVGKKLQQAFKQGELNGLHGVLVVHKGNTLVEEYFPGADERWGTPSGDIQHGPNTLHDLRSVTKSIVGLLYGIALSDGLVPALDESILGQFPEYSQLTDDALRKAITIGDALSMQMGTAWNENLPYSDPENSEIAMEVAKDRYRYVLDRPMVAKPGEIWNYNGGATAIIAHLIAKGAGMSIDKFAERRLFTPLDISDFEWVAGHDGESSAASGLRLNLRDLARIGVMLANGGSHEGTQIVPRNWIDESFEPRATLEDGLRYGYFWWLAPQGEPPLWSSGFGNGGQRLTVQPQHELVITLFAGNYNQPDDWRLPVKVIDEFLVPGLQSEIVEDK